MFKNTLPAFAAGAIFAVAVAGGGAVAFATNHDGTVARSGTGPRTGAFDAAGLAYDLDENGLTDAIAAVLKCPKGTQLTGGGGGDVTTTGYPLVGAPDNYEKWVYAVGVSEDTTEDPNNVFGSVVCFSKDGTHLSGSYRTSTTVRSQPLTGEDLTMLRQAVARSKR